MLITRVVLEGAAWTVTGRLPAVWWQNNESVLAVNCGWKSFLATLCGCVEAWAGNGTANAGGRGATGPVKRLAGAMLGSSFTGGWYWKQARSTHWSNRSSCCTGWARSSTLRHLPWARTQVLRKQSEGNDKPGGRLRNSVGVFTTKMGSIPGSCWTCSLADNPFW